MMLGSLKVLSQYIFLIQMQAVYIIRIIKHMVGISGTLHFQCKFIQATAMYWSLAVSHCFTSYLLKGWCKLEIGAIATIRGNLRP